MGCSGIESNFNSGTDRILFMIGLQPRGGLDRSSTNTGDRIPDSSTSHPVEVRWSIMEADSCGVNHCSSSDQILERVSLDTDCLGPSKKAECRRCPTSRCGPSVMSFDL